jgi:taurine dioxygenase
MKVSKLSELGGVSIEGVDLSQPLPAEQSAEIMRLYDEEGLVVVRGQSLTMPQMIVATDPFGGAEIKSVVDDSEGGVTVLSTRGADGSLAPADEEALIGYVDWHTDQAYVVAPNRGKLLYAVTIPPEGGKTGFVDGARTWAALPDAMKARIAGLHVVQSWRHATKSIQRNRGFFKNGGTELADDRFPDVAYPLVITHPRTGRQSLNVPPLWASGILELPAAEGRAVLGELIAHVRRPEFAYWHSYSPGDLVGWDNWRFLHAGSGTPGRHARTLWTTVIRGGPVIGKVIEAQAG